MVKRYDPEVVGDNEYSMEEHPQGDYVEYDDHERIVDALTEEIITLEKHIAHLNDENDDLTMEIDRLTTHNELLQENCEKLADQIP